MCRVSGGLLILMSLSGSFNLASGGFVAAPPLIVVVQSLSKTLCKPKDCSMPGFAVLHYLLEFAQTYVHWVSDVIQPPHPLLSPSPLALNLSQHQGLCWQLFISALWNSGKFMETRDLSPRNWEHTKKICSESYRADSVPHPPAPSFKNVVEKHFLREYMFLFLFCFVFCRNLVKA